MSVENESQLANNRLLDAINDILSGISESELRSKSNSVASLLDRMQQLPSVQDGTDDELSKIIDGLNNDLIAEVNSVEERENNGKEYWRVRALLFANASLMLNRMEMRFSEEDNQITIRNVSGFLLGRSQFAVQKLKDIDRAEEYTKDDVGVTRDQSLDGIRASLTGQRIPRPQFPGEYSGGFHSIILFVAFPLLPLWYLKSQSSSYQNEMALEALKD